MFNREILETLKESFEAKRIQEEKNASLRAEEAEKKNPELKKIVLTAIANIDSAISIHDFRAVEGSTHTNLIFDIVLPFESKLGEAEVKSLVSEEVSRLRSDCFCVITVDRG